MSEIVREAIRPIEYIVHNFAADYLKGIESLYILNHEEVVDNLRSKVLVSKKIGNYKLSFDHSHDFLSEEDNYLSSINLRKDF